MVGLDASDALFDTAEETGGSKNAVVVSHTHTATVADPGHVHTTSISGQTGLTGSGNDFTNDGPTPITLTTNSAFTGITVANSTEGSSGTNANVQPFIVVRMWKRTA
jgi:hypothetical protein